MKRTPDGQALAWLKRWEAHINAFEFDAARPMFEAGVFSFGTFADRLDGLDDLVERQWSEIWPHIREFRFHLEDARMIESADGSLVTIASLWSSQGVEPGGGLFPRHGRTTIVLRKGSDGILRGVHTHFSMSRGSIARADAV